MIGSILGKLKLGCVIVDEVVKEVVCETGAVTEVVGLGSMDIVVEVVEVIGGGAVVAEEIVPEVVDELVAELVVLLDGVEPGAFLHFLRVTSLEIIFLYALTL